MLLAAPSQAASRHEYSRAAILSVLQHSEILGEVLAPQGASSQLSILEVRKLRAFLEQLDESQLLEIQNQLAACNALTIECAPSPLPLLVDFTSLQALYSSPSPHLIAQNSVTHTSRYLE